MLRLKHYIPDIAEATMFGIQNVADYFWSHPQEYWDLKDLNLAPPYDFFATYWQMPNETYSSKFGQVPVPADNAGKEYLTTFRVLKYERRFDAGTGQRIFFPDARWTVEMFLFVANGSYNVFPPTRWMAYVNSDGGLVKQDDGQWAFYNVQHTDSIQTAFVPISYLHVSALALTFLHCKNVDVVEPSGSKKKKQRKDNPWSLRYRQIKVNVLGRSKQYKNHSTGASRIKQSMYIYPGVFRHYGPKYGKGLLFGKYEGKFWVAPHVKGSPSKGIVTKDYKLV